jgi:hypothetical protein
MNNLRRYAIVLCLYLNTRGFSFVLFEDSLSPYDWGAFEVRGEMKHKPSLDRINKLINRYLPDVLVMQDMGPNGTRRAERLELLNEAVAELAARLRIPVFSYSRAEVYAAFQSLGLFNKHMLAELIAKHIPAFRRRVPPPRKPWMSEDARMSLFDAAALGLVFFQKAPGEEWGSQSSS